VLTLYNRRQWCRD